MKVEGRPAATTGTSLTSVRSDTAAGASALSPGARLVSLCTSNKHYHEKHPRVPGASGFAPRLPASGNQERRVSVGVCVCMYDRYILSRGLGRVLHSGEKRGADRDLTRAHSF